MANNDKSEPSSNGQAEGVNCAYCGSANTELLGLFGAFHLATQYYCRACGSPFGVVRWQSETSSASNGSDAPS